MVKTIVCVFILVTLTIALCVIYKNPITPKTHEELKMEHNYCSNGSGEWDGKKCICKYPNIITNNDYNGNCDKIVIRNCNNFYDKDGNLFDFKTKDPSVYGICDCGKNYIYDINTHKCILKRVSDSNNIANREVICEEGYVYSKKYKICVKSICFWDILNPQVKVNQKQISDYLCECDILKGFIPIKVSDKIGGCTRALFNQPLPEMPSHIFSIVAKKENQPIHFYPQSLAGGRLKQYLGKEVLEVDDGTKMVQIQFEGFESFLDKINLNGLTFYTTSLTQLKRPVSFDDVTESLLFLTEADAQEAPISKPFSPLETKDLENNELFALPKTDEVNSEVRYINNRIYYSPIIVDINNKLIVNPEGVNSRLYNSLKLFYYPKNKIVIVEPNQ